MCCCAGHGWPPTPSPLPPCPNPTRPPAGCLADLLPYGPLIAEHCILSSGLDPARPLASAPLSAEEQGSLLGGVRTWEAWLDACEDANEAPGGYILARPAGAAGGKAGKAGKQQQQQEEEVKAGAGAAPGEGPAAGPAPSAPFVYEEFEPVLLRQHAAYPSLAFPTFDAALAEFFGKASAGSEGLARIGEGPQGTSAATFASGCRNHTVVQDVPVLTPPTTTTTTPPSSPQAAGQRAAAAQAAKEKAAVGKLEAIRKDHEKRLGSLGVEAETAQLKVRLGLCAVCCGLWGSRWESTEEEEKEG